MKDETASEAIGSATGEKARKRASSGRSPNYPFFDLERSISRAKQLYDRERVHATPVMTALKHWGYTNPSGKGGMTLSALKQFGLLEDVGRGEGRRVQLTTRAYDILHTPHDAEHQQLLRDAALTPEIHQELWDQYGASLPSDSTLAWTLTKERNFTATGADDFIRQWKRTLEFARLGEQPAQDRLDDEEVPQRSLGEMNLEELRAQPNFEREIARGRQIVDQTLSRPPQVHQVAGRATISSDASGSADLVQQYLIPIALSGRPPVVISGAFPLTEGEWRQFKAVLDAMKPVLVGELAPPHSQAAADVPD